MTSQSFAPAKRKGAYELREIGGNCLLTVRAPRDGAGRSTSLYRFKKRCVEAEHKIKIIEVAA